MVQPDITMNKPPPAPAQRVLLGEQTASTLLGNIVHVYRQHFGVIVGCVVVPIVPFLFLMEVFTETSPVLALLAGLGYFVAIFLCPAALTVVLSDICLGNQPSVKRAFSRILRHRRWWQMISTSLLILVGVLVGTVLLIVPGMWFFVRSILAATIVTLEGRSNTDAIRRSFALTKGQAWRLTGLTLLPLFLAYLVALLPMLIGLYLVSLAGEGSALAQHGMVLVIYTVMVGLLLPVGGLTTVLLYYDQRARRESYDAQALSEDLMR